MMDDEALIALAGEELAQLDLGSKPRISWTGW